MNEGLGYKRIHKVLVKEGFEVGKSPNCVNSMIKKRLKREKFLNQKDKCEYRDFKVMGMKRVLRDRKNDINKCYHIKDIQISIRIHIPTLIIFSIQNKSNH